jgi:diguanylate cyclase (GGDEF)-like protein/PAS domain S-box-containing protein
MTLQLTLVALLWSVGIGALTVLAQIWRRGQLARRPALSLLVCASALYAFGYAVELVGDSVPWVLATFGVQHLAITFAPALLLWLAADFAPRGWPRRRVWLALAFAMSLVTLAIVYTNPLHALYHANPRMDGAGPFPMFAFDRGAWYWVFQAYAALAVLTANAVFLRAHLTAPEPLRTQARMLFYASAVPWLGSLVNLSGVVPLRLDVMPFTLVVTGVLLYRGVVRQRLGDVAPIARDLVFERMGDAVVVLDMAGHVLDQNGAAVAMLGHLTERYGETQVRLAERHPELAAVVAATEQELDPGDVSVHVTLRDEPSSVTLAGRTYSVRVVELREGADRQRARVLVMRDITRYVELEAMLRKLATTDELTGIGNRRHFLESAARDLERTRRSGRPLSLLMLDLDRFKRVNDLHGHLAGDAVLRAVGVALTADLRAGDIAGRYGGEEFAILLPETDETEAALVAERVRRDIANVVVSLPGASVRVTASIGSCTTWGADAPDLDTLLDCADAAQYRAKVLGGNAVVATHPGEPARVAQSSLSLG